MAQELKTVITIGGRIDNSFGQLGSELMGLGAQIDMLGGKVREFGKDSLNEFMSYDDTMREIRAVGEFTAGEMEQLDKLNREIAKTTTYSNIQSAQAQLFMGQIGFTTKEIATMLPSVLDLAMAGNLNLADSVNYLYSVMASLDIKLEESGMITDQLAKTAAIGATDIDTLGDALTRMGSGTRMFAGGSVEVLTILSEIAKYGEDMRGATGGTALRRFALSLAAPIGANAATLEAMMQEYDISQQEWSDFLEDEGINLTAAAAVLEQLGVSAFDSEGNLRNMLDVISDLRTGIDELGNEQLATQALRQIFGQRGYIIASNILKVTDEEYNRTYREIYESDGFAAGMGETMQGGIGGAMRRFSSSYTEFKTTIGEVIAPTISDAAGWLEDMVNSLSEMDDAKLEALVSGVGAIAVAGPALITVGGAMRLIGYLMSPAGAIMLGVAAVAGVLTAIEKLDTAKYAEHFGTMTIDDKAMTDYINEMGASFGSAAEDIGIYNAALRDVKAAYETASTTLSGELLTAMLTEATLSKEDVERLVGLGNDMYTAVLSGYQFSTAKNIEVVRQLFGDDADDDEMFMQIAGILVDNYDENVAEMEDIGVAWRKLLVDSLTDGEVTPEEYAQMKEMFKELNAAMVKAQNEARSEAEQLEMEKMIYRAQSLSLEETQGYAEQMEQARAETIAMYEDEWLGADITLRDSETYAGEHKAERAELKKKWDAQRAGIEARFNENILRLYMSTLADSDLGEAWEYISGQMEGYRAGAADINTIQAAIEEEYGTNKFFYNGMGDADSVNTAVTQYLAKIISNLGGIEEVNRLAQEMESAGFTDTAKNLLNIRDASMLLTGGKEVWWGEGMFGLGSGWAWLDNKDLVESLYGKGALSDMQKYYTESVLEGLAITVNPEDMVQPNTWLDGTPLIIEPEIMPDAEEAGVDYGNRFMQNTNIFPEVEVTPSGAQAASVWVRDFNAGISGALNRVSVPTYAGGDIKKEKYGMGGRATVASIFGEAGPEWAIPEEYSDRTAGLLDAARRASGFTWPELIARAGGLNAKTGGMPSQIIYSPVIYANDAAGVEQKLREDKTRFARYMEDYQMREEIEVYA